MVPDNSGMNTAVLLPVLHTLYTLSREVSHVDVGTLSRHLRVSPIRTAEALIALEERGLCSATKCRLTMRGLTVAAAYDSSLAKKTTTALAA